MTAEMIPRFEIRPLTEKEGGGYLIEFPDYPGCIADGETPEEAMTEGRDALIAYIRTLEELGGRYRSPSKRHSADNGDCACRARCTQRLPAERTAKASARIRW